MALVCHLLSGHVGQALLKPGLLSRQPHFGGKIGWEVEQRVWQGFHGMGPPVSIQPHLLNPGGPLLQQNLDSATSHTTTKNTKLAPGIVPHTGLIHPTQLVDGPEGMDQQRGTRTLGSKINLGILQHVPMTCRNGNPITMMHNREEIISRDFQPIPANKRVEGHLIPHNMIQDGSQLLVGYHPGDGREVLDPITRGDRGDQPWVASQF